MDYAVAAILTPQARMLQKRNVSVGLAAAIGGSAALLQSPVSLAGDDGPELTLAEDRNAALQLL